jgi:hypothetical protein
VSEGFKTPFEKANATVITAGNSEEHGIDLSEMIKECIERTCMISKIQCMFFDHIEIGLVCCGNDTTECSNVSGGGLKFRRLLNGSVICHTHYVQISR